MIAAAKYSRACRCFAPIKKSGRAPEARSRSFKTENFYRLSGRLPLLLLEPPLELRGDEDG